MGRCLCRLKSAISGNGFVRTGCWLNDVVFDFDVLIAPCSSSKSIEPFSRPYVSVRVPLPINRLSRTEIPFPVQVKDCVLGRAVLGVCPDHAVLSRSGCPAARHVRRRQFDTCRASRGSTVLFREAFVFGCTLDSVWSAMLDHVAEPSSPLPRMLGY